MEKEIDYKSKRTNDETAGNDSERLCCSVCYYVPAVYSARICKWFELTIVFGLTYFAIE